MKNFVLQIAGFVLMIIVLSFGYTGCVPKEQKSEKETDTLQIIPEQPETDFTQYVNPFIGTASHGHTYPGAVLPFGMVQLSPDNGTEGWDWCSGYNYTDSTIAGFSHLHMSGTGIGDLYDVLIMPVTGELEFPKKYKRKKAFPWSPIGVKNEVMPYWSDFIHESEVASPGYYKVDLEKYKITAELTATKRVGFHRYTFPENEKASIVIDLGHSLNWDFPTETKIDIINDSLITGYRLSEGWAKKQRVYFAIAFSKPFISQKIILKGEEIDSASFIGEKLKAVLSFNLNEDEKILLKTGLSSASTEGALSAIYKEVPNWDFDKVRKSANDIWKQELNKIVVESDNEDAKINFYSALYHTSLAPSLYSDAEGNYKAPDSTVQKAENFDRYTIFSLWDTYRAAHPLYTILQKDKVNDFINSMLSFYNEHGLLPVWPLWGNETGTMIGNHAIPIIVDAYKKGYTDFDVNLAYEAMKKSVMQDHLGLEFYKKYGYIPVDKENYSVSRTLEYAYDDWCVAQMAKDLGNTEDYEIFSKRAGYYQNIFDEETGFMRGKNAEGNWDSPFDPLFSDHHQHPYTEGNAWQYIWYVPHDVKGLIKLLGGKHNFVAKLDSLFEIKQELKGENASADITGLIGQYAHGNEPSHHIAYLYNYAGQPWKTQERINYIMKNMYKPSPDGLCGNEDCGQMSAWYVFSALGFYPVNPANGIYVIGTPAFEKTKILVDDNKYFEITAKNLSNENFYIQSAKLNGVEYNKTYITHKDIVNGGKLIFTMGNTPNKKWGIDKESIPPSVL